ncbi:protein FAM107B [Centropristis striata]|uniref:protein FAM107B n=1 Tax=Centropristis striata TaxID=184440 RepID=UPI0027E184B6|nr:protein FAM107B [Centropristis striata]
MRLYNNTQVSQKMGQNRRETHHCWMVLPHQVTESPQHEGDDLIQPKKLPNPILAFHQHRDLHGELLFCHRRGLLPRRKPELQFVLENKRREQHKQRELALCPPSDLEVKLRTRQQRIEVYELEEKKRRESLQNVPEFVRVRGSLKRAQTFSW